MNKSIKSILIAGFLFLTGLSSASADTVYSDVTVTGVGIGAPGDSGLPARVRFTIDTLPGVVWLTDHYTGDQLKNLTALILTAFSTGKKIAYLQTTDPIPTGGVGTNRYVKVTAFEVGTITHD